VGAINLVHFVKRKEFVINIDKNVTIIKAGSYLGFLMKLIMRNINPINEIKNKNGPKAKGKIFSI
jgi:hypothetical protein